MDYISPVLSLACVASIHLVIVMCN